MKKISNNREFTLAFQSRSSFLYAKSLVDFHVQLGLSDNDKRSVILLGAISGYYAAPFMSSNQLGRLSHKIVPSEFRVTHTNLIDLRNKVFMHLDKDVDILSVANATNIRVIIDATSNSIKFESRSFSASSSAIEGIANLLVWWTEHLDCILNDYLHLQTHNTMPASGTYILSTAGNRFEFIPE